MIAENGKILKCTEDELFGYYLDRGFDDIMSFNVFRKQCESAGTEVVDENNNEFVIKEVIELLDEIKEKLEKLL